MRARLCALTVADTTLPVDRLKHHGPPASQLGTALKLGSNALPGLGKEAIRHTGWSHGTGFTAGLGVKTDLSKDINAHGIRRSGWFSTWKAPVPPVSTRIPRSDVR